MCVFRVGVIKCYPEGFSTHVHHPKRGLTNPDAEKGSNLILHLFLLVFFFTACIVVIRHHEKPRNSRSYFLSSLRILIPELGGGFKYFLVIYFHVFFFCAYWTFADDISKSHLYASWCNNGYGICAAAIGGGGCENSSNKIPHGFLHQPKFGFV